MIVIFVIFDGKYTLQDENGTTVEKNESPLQPGKYYIVSPSKLVILFNGSGRLMLSIRHYSCQ
jgi:hypothetical protein